MHGTHTKEELKPYPHVHCVHWKDKLQFKQKEIDDRQQEKPPTDGTKDKLLLQAMQGQLLKYHA